MDHLGIVLGSWYGVLASGHLGCAAIMGFLGCPYSSGLLRRGANWVESGLQTLQILPRCPETCFAVQEKQKDFLLLRSQLQEKVAPSQLLNLGAEVDPRNAKQVWPSLLAYALTSRSFVFFSLTSFRNHWPAGFLRAAVLPPFLPSANSRLGARRLLVGVQHL